MKKSKTSKITEAEGLRLHVSVSAESGYLYVHPHRNGWRVRVRTHCCLAPPFRCLTGPGCRKHTCAPLRPCSQARVPGDGGQLGCFDTAVKAAVSVARHLLQEDGSEEDEDEDEGEDEGEEEEEEEEESSDDSEEDEESDDSEEDEESDDSEEDDGSEEVEEDEEESDEDEDDEAAVPAQCPKSALCGRPTRHRGKCNRSRASVGDGEEMAVAEKKEEAKKEEDEEFVVGALLDSYGTGKDRLFRVRWKGYEDEAEDTWEPAAAIPRHFITSFERELAQVGEGLRPGSTYKRLSAAYMKQVRQQAKVEAKAQRERARREERKEKETRQKERQKERHREKKEVAREQEAAKKERTQAKKAAKKERVQAKKAAKKERVQAKKAAKKERAQAKKAANKERAHAKKATAKAKEAKAKEDQKAKEARKTGMARVKADAAAEAGQDRSRPNAAAPTPGSFRFLIHRAMYAS